MQWVALTAKARKSLIRPLGFGLIGSVLAGESAGSPGGGSAMEFVLNRANQVPATPRSFAAAS